MTDIGRSRLVNALTFIRAPLIFTWAVLAVLHETSAAASHLANLSFAVGACAAMLLSGLTDMWDGWLARRWNVVSTLGKMSDPLMDKVFFIVAFPVLLWQAMHQDPGGAHGFVLLLFTVLYVLRDTWVTFMRSVGTMYGADVAAMWLGKVRTALSFPGAGWIYLYLAFHSEAPERLRGIWLGSCYAVEAMLVILTVWSIFTYTFAYLPYMKKAMTHR